MTLTANPTERVERRIEHTDMVIERGDFMHGERRMVRQRPTSGSASTGALTATDNAFTLTCNRTGGSTSASANVTVRLRRRAMTGLDFPGSAATSGTVRFRFTNPLAIYPATYMWRVKPRQQNGYYTTFFWGNDGEFAWGGGRRTRSTVRIRIPRRRRTARLVGKSPPMGRRLSQQRKRRLRRMVHSGAASMVR